MEWLRRIIEEDYHRVEMTVVVTVIVGLGFAVMTVVLTSIVPSYENYYAMHQTEKH
jgi:hypothetical protein